MLTSTSCLLCALLGRKGTQEAQLSLVGHLREQPLSQLPGRLGFEACGRGLLSTWVLPCAVVLEDVEPRILPGPGPPRLKAEVFPGRGWELRLLLHLCLLPRSGSSLGPPSAFHTFRL